MSSAIAEKTNHMHLVMLTEQNSRSALRTFSNSALRSVAAPQPPAPRSAPASP